MRRSEAHDHENDQNDAEADIAPCGGDGNVDVGDVLATLSAFAGENLCPLTPKDPKIRAAGFIARGSAVPPGVRGSDRLFLFDPRSCSPIPFHRGAETGRPKWVKLLPKTDLA